MRQQRVPPVSRTLSQPLQSPLRRRDGAREELTFRAFERQGKHEVAYPQPGVRRQRGQHQP